MGMYNQRDRVYRVGQVDVTVSSITYNKTPAVNTHNSKRTVISAQEREIHDVDPKYSERVANPAKTVNPKESAITEVGRTIDKIV